MYTYVEQMIVKDEEIRLDVLGYFYGSFPSGEREDSILKLEFQ